MNCNTCGVMLSEIYIGPDRKYNCKVCACAAWKEWKEGERERLIVTGEITIQIKKGRGRPRKIIQPVDYVKPRRKIIIKRKGGRK